MARWIPAAVIAVWVLGAPGAYAQAPDLTGRFPSGDIEGRVLDDARRPVVGAMVSVVGRTTAAAATDRDGRYALRTLPYGPYILSVHSSGYFRSRSRTVQLTAPKVSLPEIQLLPAHGGPVEMPPAAETAAPPQLAGFGVDAAPAARGASDEAGQEDTGETAWRLRHLPRSILKDAAFDAAWTEGVIDSARWFGRASAAVPVAFFSDLPLSGQVNLLTIESFDRPGEIFAADAARSVAFVAVNTEAAGGAWAMQGAMTQGDLSSWIVAGSYKSIESASHAYELGVSYSTQRYEGGNATTLGALRENTRNVGSVYGYDQWTISPRFVLGYGTGYARYDYLEGSGVWSPRLSVTVPLDGFRISALASRKALVPGAEEFAPSATGMWLPPQRTFSSLAYNGRFTPEHIRHLQVAVERDLAPGVSVSLRGFDQRIDDQLIEIFRTAPGRADATRGHYYVATAGDIDTRGWGAAITHEVPGYVRGTIEYTVTTAWWDTGSDLSMAYAVRAMPATPQETVYDLHTSIEATIPQTATRVYAKYRVNTAFWSAEPDALQRASANARFNVRVSQALPFLRFSSADWEALVDIRNMFRDMEVDSSIYDEAFAIRAPKRIVGGLQVRF